MDSQRTGAVIGDEKTSGSLRAITSYATGRYDNSTLVDPYSMDISPGLFTTSQDPEPQYLPPLWSAHVHPEGQLYFYLEGPLPVVTEAYLYHPETLESACLWIDYIRDMFLGAKVDVSRETELFIKLEEDGCAYYFVEHSTRTQFWLETSSTEKLGLPAVLSTSHLKIVLEELYWLHVEHFPMHLKPISSETLQDLMSIFSHGLCDQMTSRVSTFIYTAQECNSFLTILEGCRGNITNGRTTWIIARLSSIIGHHKYITYYGQEHSRLSRDQSILFDPEQKHRWISRVFASLTFKVSDDYVARLDDVFVDRIVYADQWARLMGDCLEQWRSARWAALSGLMLHFPFLVLNSPSPLLLTTSVTLFGSGLASSILLQEKYEPMQGLSATQAMNYLDTVQSRIFKFQLMAFVFSLPKALHLWGFVLFLANCLLMAVQYLGLKAAIVLGAISLLLVITLYCTISETFHAICGKCTGFLGPKTEDMTVQMV
ncbi:hypothetical protein DFH07DRAFT_1054549 [Mycena maculata]|uniref:WW domain-containing protein n=1 Tax=Mycena maculata TaxID=230809 RepID=A0AAD7KI21_9AGAR|nr:hypothetical protein DFH07DRAFT_1054549 [Mycena maculata]